VAIPTGRPGKPYCFDTTCLAHFARAERLDVLRELLIDHECWTTTVVLAELRRGTESYPLLADAVNLEWIRVASLDALDELSCFVPSCFVKKGRSESGLRRGILERPAFWRRRNSAAASLSPTTAMPLPWREPTAPRCTGPFGSWRRLAGKKS
jgi:hypothetical protein